ncbi:MAG: endonuclease/exonuclease/phosphatase family protein [Mycobacteriales bacterium]
MRRSLTRLLLVTAVLAPLSAPVTAYAGQGTTLTVMSRNLYLGADLTPAIAATSVPAFLGAVAGIYGNVLATDFPTRAGALADEVAATAPDLIGLQEVSRWTVIGNSPAPSLDFLAILQAQLAARDLHYAVAAVSDNASIGPVPLVGPFCRTTGVYDCLLLFQDRDVILVNTDRSGLSATGARHGRYASQQVVSTPVGPLSFDRGWATVQVALGTHRLRFALTHLETEDAPAVQEAEGREFLAAVKAPGNVLAVGDFNSASDGSTTSTYADLTGDYFRDAARGVGPTCCQSGTLANSVSQLHSRIDLVLSHGALLPRSAIKVGAVPFQAQAPYWPSDHAGVVATLRLP